MTSVLTLDPALSLRAASSKVNQVITKPGLMESLMIAGSAGGGA